MELRVAQCGTQLLVPGLPSRVPSACLDHTDTSYQPPLLSHYDASLFATFPQCLNPCHGEPPLSPTQLRVISEHLLEHSNFLLCDEDSVGELR